MVFYKVPLYVNVVVLTYAVWAQMMQSDCNILLFWVFVNMVNTGPVCCVAAGDGRTYVWDQHLFYPQGFILWPKKRF